MTDWLEAMRRRHSVRRYLREPLAEAEVSALREACDSAVAFRPEVPVRLLLVPYADIGRRRAVAWVPLYNAAPWYIVMACAEVPGRMEEVGFRGEQVILAAASVGLDTCWVAGTFDPGLIASACGLPIDEVIAVSPVGRGETGALQAVTTTLAKPLAMRAGKRKPLAEFVYAGRWGVAADESNIPQPLWQAMEMVRSAPSWANTQPWAFLFAQDALWALADSRPQRGNDVPAKPYWRLDAGIAMAHVHLAMLQSGRPSPWRLPPQPPSPALGIPGHFVPLAWRSLG